jgi:hypothetical protein
MQQIFADLEREAHPHQARVAAGNNIKGKKLMSLRISLRIVRVQQKQIFPFIISMPLGVVGLSPIFLAD